MILGGLVFSTMVSEKKASVYDVTAPKISSKSAGEDDKVWRTKLKISSYEYVMRSSRRSIWEKDTPMDCS